VKVKVGPITVSYKGIASFQEKDVAAQRVVLKAEGKETRGNGTAAALVTAQLKDDGDSTNVTVGTDLAISGKAAQFGRSVLADVAGNLIAQFARSLEAELGGAAPAPASAAEISSGTTATAAATADAGDSVDLLKVVAMPMAKRAAPVAAGLAAGVALGFLVGRRRRQARVHPAALRAEDLLEALSRLVS
jgi:hypothetical protein